MSPTGGRKDTKPPQLVSVSPADSQLNNRVTRIEMAFDEYITVSDVGREVQISPILAMPHTVTTFPRKIVVRIADSLLDDSTTYRITFGNAVRDLHEGNPFAGYAYTFSTTSYFDSLQVSGKVIDAATGLPDTGAVILLYSAAKSDSAVVREKPKYVGKVTSGGMFAVKGLPARRFHIYALRDANTNLIYDGGDELVGFYDNVVLAGDTSQPQILLRLFREVADSGGVDSLFAPEQPMGLSRKMEQKDKKDEFNYSVGVDTSDVRKRTAEITKPVRVIFNKPLDSIYVSRLSITYDSAEITVEGALRAWIDSATPNVMLINSDWKENTVYTLRLLKGFAKDTLGNETMPSRFTFRTKRDDDYGKLKINIPSKYYGNQYLLMVVADKDTIHFMPVTDTVVSLRRLMPGSYTMRIIVDKNENRKWDTGDLLGRRQPEEVIPYMDVIAIKAGWDNTIDFEPTLKPKPGMSNNATDTTEAAPPK